MIALSLAVIFLADHSAVASQESPQSFTFQGQLLNAAGTAPASGTISLTLDVYDPAGQCLLYEETQTGIDLTSSQGLFSVSVGSPTGATKRTANDPALTMAQVFANSGAQTRASGAANCTAGYTPVPGDTRTLRVTITPQGGSAIVLSPDQVIDSAPQANVAETLQGVGPTQFVQITGNGSTAYSTTKTALDALLGTGSGGVVDASAYHTHDGRYVQIGTTPQNIGSGGWYTSGVAGAGVMSAPSGEQFEVLSTSAATVGEVVKASSGQTADLLDIESNSGTVLASFNSSGALSVPSIALGASGYLTLGVFATPPASCSTAGEIWYSGGSIQYCNGTTVETLGTSGAGLQSLNGQTGNTQTFGAPTTAGTTLGWTSATDTHTLNIPLASTATVTAGLLSNADYSSFSGKVGGAANLSHAGAIPQVSGAGSITEASGLSYGQSANITNFTLKAGSSQSTNDLEDWLANGGSTLYSLNSSGSPTATTDLVSKSYVTSAITSAAGNYVPVGGGTMTGTLNLPANGLVAGTNQFVLSGGKVGIGTASPGSPLQVNGTTQSTAFLAGSAGSNSAPAFVLPDGNSGIYQSSPGFVNLALNGINSAQFSVGASSIYSPLSVTNGNVSSSTALSVTSQGSGYAATFSGGNVGIGTTSPGSALTVANASGATTPAVATTGAIVSNQFTVSSGSSVDFSKGNVAVLTSAVAGTTSWQLSNMVSGGSYTLIINDTAGHTYSFNASGSNCSNESFQPTNTATVAGSLGYTVYTILYFNNGGGNCLISWVTGF